MEVGRGWKRIYLSVVLFRPCLLWGDHIHSTAQGTPLHPYAVIPIHVYKDTATVSQYDICVGAIDPHPHGCHFGTRQLCPYSHCISIDNNGTGSTGCTQHLCTPIPAKHGPAQGTHVIAPLCEQGLTFEPVLNFRSYFM